MNKLLSLLSVLALATLGACFPTATPIVIPAESEAPETDAAKVSAPSELKMTALPEFTAGPYKILPKYEDELSDGHVNLYIAGGEIGAVRIWVGQEDPAGSMVVKSEIENDYWHGHLEMPNPIPADARLWVEIENPAGEASKGSTALQ